MVQFISKSCRDSSAELNCTTRRSVSFVLASLVSSTKESLDFRKSCSRVVLVSSKSNKAGRNNRPWGEERSSPIKRRLKRRHRRWRWLRFYRKKRDDLCRLATPWSSLGDDQTINRGIREEYLRPSCVNWDPDALSTRQFQFVWHG